MYTSIMYDAIQQFIHPSISPSIIFFNFFLNWSLIFEKLLKILNNLQVSDSYLHREIPIAELLEMKCNVLFKHRFAVT